MQGDPPRATYELAARTQENALAGTAEMTGRQCRRARQLLGWSPEQLSERLGGHPSVSAIRNFERGWIRLIPDSAAAVRAEFEDAGIEFDPDGEEVRCSKQ